MKVLICFDGSSFSEKVLEFTTKLCVNGRGTKMPKKSKHDITLLYVGKKDIKSEYYVERIEEELKLFREIEHKKWKDPSEEILERGKKILADMGIEAKTKYREGDPANEIIAESREGYDMLVIGSHGSGGISILMGHTYSTVAKTSKIPVLIVKHVEE
jgi:nucleotide-binding universal stress UspA family protein